jgi:hypothetical protein
MEYIVSKIKSISTKTSLIVLVAVQLFLVYTNTVFYPTWNSGGVGSTISWDVAGYYAYLPAVFINQDLKTLTTTTKVASENNVQPGGFSSAFKLPNGNSVMKYTVGNSIMMLPFFLIAHSWAKIGNYTADGFSFPYQFCISMGCLAYAFFALFVLRKTLLQFFNDKVVAITILLLVLATNFLEYSAITGALTHNQLFFVYCLILWFIIKYYKSPSLLMAAIVGSLIGLAMLIRPTEAILIALFLMWNMMLSFTSFKQKIEFIKKHLLHYGLFFLMVSFVFSIQLIYWKYVSGHWLMYTYGEQSFDWLHPQILNGLFSFRKGWYLYTPIMFFASIGFYFLHKHHKQLVPAMGVFMLLNIYVVFSWAIWWYATSLGQRAMVQSYAVMGFPLAAFINWVIFNNRFIKITSILVFIFCIYININLTWQAHKAIYFEGDNMTQRYFLRTVGRWNIKLNDLKLLDTEEEYKGVLQNVDVVKSIKNDTLKINENNQFSKIIEFNIIDKNKKWLRVSANFYASPKEGNVWQMPQLVVRFKNKNEVIKSRIIRVSRLMNDDHQWHELYIDVIIPQEKFDVAEVQLWNANSKNQLLATNLIVKVFN